MKILFATGLAFAALTTVSFAQQPPAAPSPAAPSAQAQPATPLSVVPEVMNTPETPPPHGRDTPPPPPGRDAPPPPRGDDTAMRGHHGHMPPPPPPSKAAHFRIASGDTKIDVKCADDEPTKVCADVLLQIMDKLAPGSDTSDDDQQ
jgi:hypothetical protein